MLNLSDLKLGTLVSINNQPYQIVWQNHVHTARGKAVLQTKLKNLLNGKVVEESFKDGDRIEEARVSRRAAQFLYSDESNVHLMDHETYETLIMAKDYVKEFEPYLKEGLDCLVLFFEGKALKLEIPKKIAFQVVTTAPGVRGDTATGGTKPATVETGATFNVPLFIKEGDKIIVNTETGQYVERA